jgi:hypothetical protein
VYASFKAMEDRIVDSTSPGARIPVSPAAWQSGVQSFLTAFDGAASAGRQSDTKGAAHTGDVILLRLILVGGAGLAAVIISALLLVRFGRRMTRELTSLLMAVRALADERLPLVLHRLRHGERVDIAAEVPPLTLRASTREVTEIAEAFSAVQRTAMGLCLVALERGHHERETGLVSQQADGDLWLQPPLLGEAAFAEPVSLAGLEIQGGAVIRHQARRPRPACPAHAAEICCRHDCLANTPSRRVTVRYGTGGTPASSSTRALSTLLTGSMIRASTSWRNTSSPPVAAARPSAS